jgi:hypothetical protein
LNSEGKVQVKVRSSKVPNRTMELSDPIYSVSGSFIGFRRSRVVLYDSILADHHLRAIEEGHRLSCSLGLKLEIVDLSRANFLRRLMSLFGRGVSVRPTFVVTPHSHQSQGDLSKDVFRAR